MASNGSDTGKRGGSNTVLVGAICLILGFAIGHVVSDLNLLIKPRSATVPAGSSTTHSGTSGRRGERGMTTSTPDTMEDAASGMGDPN